MALRTIKPRDGRWTKSLRVQIPLQEDGYVRACFARTELDFAYHLLPRRSAPFCIADSSPLPTQGDFDGRQEVATTLPF